MHKPVRQRKGLGRKDKGRGLWNCFVCRKEKGYGSDRGSFGGYFRLPV